ncbi:MAG TPA: serine/threonine-protein kinase, partial [Polyangiaceae bacterium]|nr:serine/threonine-protein kinase [Polyangiaceae bacterium]
MTEFREFQDGEVIAGTRYRVIRLIGVGGMGSVYEVEHMELGKRFVLKALLRELARREDLVARLRNEWRALARLQHANIVNVTDAGTSGNGVPFYVMERLDGDTLAAHLKKKRRLHVLEAVGIAASVLDALSAAHDIGIIHRDVKPANIFLVGGGGGVKLLDFGVAKIADASSVVTARGLAVGTPRYMSPEQARGERVDGRSDVYASGLILFEMIAGVGPFDDARDSNELLLAHLAREAPPLSSLVMGVSPELERILLSMLAKDIRARPAHARQIAQQLRDFSARQQRTPSTDAPTVQAGYGAPTVVAERPIPSRNHNHTTRPEGIIAGRLSSEPTRSDAALTQPILARPQTTQVTLSINTGDAYSVGPAPNTTFVSPPSFDGSTTQEISTIGPASSSGAFGPPSSAPPPGFPFEERVDRTEMLGELTPSVPHDAVATRTRVPLPELARPNSVTPPPVVDTGRPRSTAIPRVQRFGRVAALAAAALSVLLVAGFVVRRGKPTAGVDPGHVAGASSAAVSVSALSQPPRPAAVAALVSAPAVVVPAPLDGVPQAPGGAASASPNSPAITGN